jgi:glycerate kinase
LKASTFGTGLMIKHAIEQGAKKIILGLGGSATNDAGAGILKALGFECRDEHNHSLAGTGENLIHIRKIIPPPVIPDIHIDIAVDVQNTLYGPQGAAYVYAPQKGATPQDVALLDQGLKNFASLLPKDIANIPGTGAAGGIAAGLMAFFDVKLSKGIDWIINTSGIRNAIDDAGVIITGEGKIDNQSTYGKVVSEIATLAKEHHIPAIAFCGITDIDKTGIDQLGLEDVIPIKPDNMPAAEAMAQGARLLHEKAAAYIGIFSP